MFLKWHLRNTFQNDLIDFKDFIEIMYIKYDRILCGENNQKVVFKYLDVIEVEVEEIINTEVLENDGTEIKINLPNLPRAKNRKNGDGLTCLSREQTALLIDTLREINVILKEEFQYNTNVAKAVQVLTGYSHNKLRTALTAPHKKEDLIATQEILQKAIDLINKHLKKK